MHRIYFAFGLCSLLFASFGSTASKTRRRSGIGKPDGAAEIRRVPGPPPGRGRRTDRRRNTHVRLLRNNPPAAARVSIAGSDGKPYGPAGAAFRKTKRDESYFYADDSFDVELPPGRVRINVSGGLETIPQTFTWTTRRSRS